MGCLALTENNDLRPGDLTRIEYLYILNFIELLKKVDPGYTDPYITAQYIDQTKTFPVSDYSFELIERVHINHKERIISFINSKYEKVLRIILKYIKENLKNPEKYDPVPMTPAMKHTVDTFLEDDKLTRINWRFDRYNRDTCGMDREVEAMAAMVIGNFQLHESLMNVQAKTWKSDIHNQVINNQYTTVDLIKLDKFIDMLGNRYVSFVDHKPESTLLKMKYMANILNIIMHLIIPVQCVPKVFDTLYEDLFKDGVLDINKIKSTILRNKDLTRFNLNNIITANNKHFINTKQNRTIPFEYNHQIERYLVLHNVVSNLGYFCGMV